MTQTGPDTPKGQPSAIICYATCWSCKFGYCYDEPTPHPWFGSEDEEGREEAGLPPLEGDCACLCTRTDIPKEA